MNLYSGILHRQSAQTRGRDRPASNTGEVNAQGIHKNAQRFYKPVLCLSLSRHKSARFEQRDTLSGEAFVMRPNYMKQKELVWWGGGYNGSPIPGHPSKGEYRDRKRLRCGHPSKGDVYEGTNQNENAM